MVKPKLVIFGDPKRRFASEAVENFLRFASDKAQIIANCFRDKCTIGMLKNADFAVVFGGDGTILSAARQLSQTSVPVIGVNVGKLGFLAEFAPDELPELFDRIITEPVIEKRMILSCRVTNDGQIRFSSTAVNDVVIAAGTPFNMIELKMTVQDQALTGCISDGLIVSTPTGSTAYNLSAGGPILSAGIFAIVITPLAPHSLSFRPIVISADDIVRIQTVRVNEETALLLDGHVSHRLIKNDIVMIERDKGSFLVVNNPMRTKWDTLAQKLNWAEKPKYTNNIYENE